MTDPPNKKQLKTAPAPTISILSSECVESLLGDFLENRDKGLLSVSCKELYERKSKGWWRCYCCEEHISDCKFSEMKMCIKCCNVDCGGSECEGFRTCSKCSKYYCEDCVDEVMQGCEIGACDAQGSVCCVELGKCGECGRRNCAECFEAGGYCNHCDAQFCHSCVPSGGMCEDCYENNEDGDY